MKILWTIICLLPCSLVVAQEEMIAKVPDRGLQRTESATRQFVIHGSQITVRSRLASLAEEVKASLIERAGVGPVDPETNKAEWRHPIVIELHGAPGDPAPTKLMATDFHVLPNGFRLQLDVHLARGIDRELLEWKLLELLLYERGLRDEDPDTVPDRIALSPWLVDGMLESIRWERKEVDRDLYKALFERNAVFPVEEMLDVESVDEMDGVTRTTFRVSAGAMVMALLAQDGGKMAVQRFLADVATFDGDEVALLRKHFPGMNLGSQSLSKWWALQLMSMSQADILDTMTIRESEKALEELLVLKVMREGADGGVLEIGPANHQDLAALPLSARRQALRPVFERANVLQYRLFPAHRPMLRSYLEILSAVAGEQDENFDKRLEELEIRREIFSKAGERLLDYLNWYQITTSRNVSGEFSDYLELRRRLEEEEPQRDGPISEYLDRMEKFQEKR